MGFSLAVDSDLQLSPNQTGKHNWERYSRIQPSNLVLRQHAFSSLSLLESYTDGSWAWLWPLVAATWCALKEAPLWTAARNFLQSQYNYQYNNYKSITRLKTDPSNNPIVHEQAYLLLKRRGLFQIKGSTEFGASVLNQKACLEGNCSDPKILESVCMNTGWPECMHPFWKEAAPNQRVQQRVNVTFKSLLMIPHSLERNRTDFLRSLGWLLAEHSPLMLGKQKLILTATQTVPTAAYSSS